MNRADTCFLLNAVPAEIAVSYLHRTFGWQTPDNNPAPRILFIHHYQASPPDACAALATAFPEASQIFTTDRNETAFLISATPLMVHRILTFLSSIGDQTLSAELENQLEPKPPASFRIRDQVWNGDRPRIMGILNITPDSFYDGGRYFKQEDYSDIALGMIEAGADIIDVGGESSRPGAEAVDEEEEMSRVLTAIRQIRDRFNIPLSIDTIKPVVADAALAAGADMVNDISGLASDTKMLRVIQAHKAAYCLMHIQGKPETMQNNPQYEDVISDIYRFFLSRLTACEAAGLEKDRILLDPGIGFGKTVLNNIDILRLLPAFANLGCQLLLGTSNKSFFGHLLNREICDRTAGTMATQALGWMQGAAVFRVHDIEKTRDTLEIARFHTREIPLM